MGLCAFAPLSTGCDALLSASLPQVAAVLTVSVVQVFVATVSVTLTLCVRLHSFVITDSLLLLASSFFALSSILESLALFISSGTASTLTRLHSAAASLALVSLLCLFVHIFILLYKSYIRHNIQSTQYSPLRLPLFFSLFPLFAAVLITSIITIAKLNYYSYLDIFSVIHVVRISDSPGTVPTLTSIVTGLSLAFISVAALFVLIHPIVPAAPNYSNHPQSITSSTSATLINNYSSSSSRPEYFGIQIYWVFLAFVLQSVAFVLYFTKQSFVILVVQRVLSFLAFCSFILEQHTRLSTPRKSVFRTFDGDVPPTPTIIKSDSVRKRKERPSRLHPISILSSSRKSKRLTKPHLSLQLSPLFFDISNWSKNRHSRPNSVISSKRPVSGHILHKTRASSNAINSPEYYYAEKNDIIDKIDAYASSSAPPGLTQDPTLPVFLRGDRRNETHLLHPNSEAKLVQRSVKPYKRRNTDDDTYDDIEEDDNDDSDTEPFYSYSSTTLGNVLGQPPRRRRGDNNARHNIIPPSSSSQDHHQHLPTPELNSAVSLHKSNSIRDLHPATSLSALQRMAIKELRVGNKTEDDLSMIFPVPRFVGQGVDGSTGSISNVTAGGGVSSLSLGTTHHNISTEWTVQELGHQVQIINDTNPNNRIMSIHGKIGSHWRNSRSSSTFGHSVDGDSINGHSRRYSLPPSSSPPPPLPPLPLPLPGLFSDKKGWNLSDSNLSEHSKRISRTSRLWPPVRSDSKRERRSISTPSTSISHTHPSALAAPAVLQTQHPAVMTHESQSTPSLRVFKQRKSSLSPLRSTNTENEYDNDINNNKAASTPSLATKNDAESISSSSSKSSKIAPLNIVKK